jgi:hypothetical protein
MSASIKSNSSGNLELFSGSTKVLEANAGTGVVSGLKVTNATATGQAVNYDQVLGVGQTWQDVTASRTAGVTYTNTTGKPIVVVFEGSNSTSGRKIYLNGFAVVSLSTAGVNQSYVLIVPNGYTYKRDDFTTYVSTWELR